MIRWTSWSGLLYSLYCAIITSLCSSHALVMVDALRRTGSCRACPFREGRYLSLPGAAVGELVQMGYIYICLGHGRRRWEERSLTRQRSSTQAGVDVADSQHVRENNTFGPGS